MSLFRMRAAILCWVMLGLAGLPKGPHVNTYPTNGHTW